MHQAKSTICFSVRLLQSNAIELPKSASAKLPSRVTTMVEGTINGFPFRAALEPNAKGPHSLNISKALQAAAGADATDAVTIEITRVGEEPEPRLPIELHKALVASPP